ncbi:2-oxoacid:acceptor oxidoreductase subunit alpha [Clostridium sp. 'White wine YQ']|uniref:2-oxoacid:acceptor oxidoreductase subunit alpha n=1 Tax=Clostridium sp. 'White wine YQ' TaxID=3027474 RepID=UPI002365C414|nr:2-oxoacid:acceptor oxidoreductase subunit alpha [Clostridium sp. 'White wine YQ']MDD7793106.1 2-oxoacid:acceptor oxidoreductase subunit alpha [Clostridium sp. 'White wine YQ']
MKYNILIGGAAGQGMDTISDFLEKILKLKGYNVFSNKDYMSRVRGGHNFIQVRFGDEPIYSHSPNLDFIFALDQNTVDIHLKRLSSEGIAIVDEGIHSEDDRVKTLPLKKISLELKLSKALGMVGLGAILKFFGISLDKIEEVFPKKFAAEIREINLKALTKGYELVNKKYELKPLVDQKNLILDGNTSIALGALAGGLNFYCGYPMTPATSVMTYLSKKQLQAGIVVEQVEDEIAALNMAIGASYAGARAMTGSSGGGVALMVEAFGLAGITETPIVVLDSQRPGPATGLPTRTEQSDLSFLLTASQGEFPRAVLSVRNAEDAFYQTFKALNIAEKYQTLVVLLTDQYLADAKVTVPYFNLDMLTIDRGKWREEEFQEGEEYKRYLLTDDGISPRIVPGKIKGQTVLVDSDEHNEDSHITESEKVRIEQMEKRMKKQKLIENDIEEPKYMGSENPQVILIGWGSTFGALKEAVELLNKEEDKFGALSFGDIYPLPKKTLEKYKGKVKFINVEQNFTGQLGKLITQETGILMDSSILKYDGRQINGYELVERLKSEVK